MRAGKSLKILVADDNEVNLKVLIGMLEFDGHEVDSADDGEAVLDALERKQYQLLILDCMMPQLDGFQVARKIRAGDGSLCDPAIPILAVTALATQGDQKRCLEAGMTGFCSKPVQAKALFAWIARQFGSRGKAAKQDFSLAKEPACSVSTANGAGLAGLNQRDWVKQMSTMLIRDATDWQLQLRKLLASNNHDGLAKLAHKIRGTADVLGFPDLSAKATRLERSSECGTTASAASTQVAEVIAALQQVIEEVQKPS